VIKVTFFVNMNIQQALLVCSCMCQQSCYFWKARSSQQCSTYLWEKKVQSSSTYHRLLCNQTI